MLVCLCAHGIGDAPHPGLRGRGDARAIQPARGSGKALSESCVLGRHNEAHKSSASNRWPGVGGVRVQMGHDQRQTQREAHSRPGADRDVRQTGCSGCDSGSQACVEKDAVNSGRKIV